jgi:hypothetical protein
MWLREYVTKYEAWEENNNDKTEKASNPSASLSVSWFRARATFFDPIGHLELNLPSAVVSELVCAASGAQNVPPPQAFRAVQQQVELMLEESLSRFISRSCHNAGTRRGLFATTAGIFTVLVGLIPIFCSFFLKESRWVRLAAFFPIWLGLVVTFCGLQGVRYSPL